MYQQKYLKYKTKYKNLKSIQTAGSRNIILLDGPSSSGKTIIAKVFEEHGYKYIASDDYSKQGFTEFMKKIPNEYGSREEKMKSINLEIRRLMYDESKKFTKIIFDDIQQDILNFFNRNDIFIVIVYTPLNDLVRNIVARKTTSYRGLFVFEQFAKRYVKTDSSNDGIDKINVNNFIENLKQIKFEFDSEENLIEFAKNIFSKMGISDDNDHYIRLHNNYVYDYILNTSNKTPKMIYDELKNL